MRSLWAPSRRPLRHYHVTPGERSRRMHRTRKMTRWGDGWDAVIENTLDTRDLARDVLNVFLSILKAFFSSIWSAAVACGAGPRMQLLPVLACALPPGVPLAPFPPGPPPTRPRADARGHDLGLGVVLPATWGDGCM